MESDSIKSSELNSVLNPTFHDVEIKLVEIINPNTSTVKFKEHPVSHNNFEQMNTSQSQADQESTAVKTSSPPIVINENSDNSKLQKNAVQFSDHIVMQKSEVRGFPLHVMAGQVEPNQADAEQRINQQHTYKTAKQKHKEEIWLKKQQFMESFSRNSRQHSAKRRENRFFEVAPGVLVSEQPLTRGTPDPGELNYPPTNNGFYPNRAATVPGSKPRIWTGHRSTNSRIVSTVSSRWMVDELVAPKPNHFIKMPFKQMIAAPPESQAKLQDELFLPGDEMRATTAFALSRIRHAFRRMAPPTQLNSRQGRLLKARLRPMRPVTQMNAAHISSCRGIQPEGRKQRTGSPDPARLKELKQKYLEVCNLHGRTTIQDEIKRRREAHSAPSEQSVHPTSPELYDPDDFLLEKVSLPLEFSEKAQIDENHQYFDKYARENDFGEMSQKMASLRMDSSVIY